MVKALRSLPGERREISLKPWLYRVAHNESISILRSRRTRSSSTPSSCRPSTTVERHAADARTVRALVADLETLPERQRASLVMRELNGLSYDEIGAALGDRARPPPPGGIRGAAALLEVAEGREMECRAAPRETISGRRRPGPPRPQTPRAPARLRGLPRFGPRSASGARRWRRWPRRWRRPPRSPCSMARSAPARPRHRRTRVRARRRRRREDRRDAARGGRDRRRSRQATGVLDRGGDARAPDREPAAAPAQPSSQGPADRAGKLRRAARRRLRIGHSLGRRSSRTWGPRIAVRRESGWELPRSTRQLGQRPGPGRERQPRRPRRRAVRDRAPDRRIRTPVAAARRRRPGRPPPPPGRPAPAGSPAGARADGRVARCQRERTGAHLGARSGDEPARASGQRRRPRDRTGPGRQVGPDAGATPTFQRSTEGRRRP